MSKPSLSMRFTWGAIATATLFGILMFVGVRYRGLFCELINSSAMTRAIATPSNTAN
jgi:hypothetical protein